MGCYAHDPMFVMRCNQWSHSHIWTQAEMRDLQPLLAALDRNWPR